MGAGCLVAWLDAEAQRQHHWAPRVPITACQDSGHPPGIPPLPITPDSNRLGWHVPACDRTPAHGSLQTTVRGCNRMQVLHTTQKQGPQHSHFSRRAGCRSLGPLTDPPRCPLPSFGASAPALQGLTGTSSVGMRNHSPSACRPITGRKYQCLKARDSRPGPVGAFSRGANISVYGLRAGSGYESIGEGGVT